MSEDREGWANPTAEAGGLRPRISIKNVGERAYDDSPANGANVVDDEGQSYEASLFGEVAGLHNLGSVTISPGGTRKGAVVFEVPENAKIVTLQVALDSGFAQHTGEWALP